MGVHHPNCGMFAVRSIATMFTVAKIHYKRSFKRSTNKLRHGGGNLPDDQLTWRRSHPESSTTVSGLPIMGTTMPFEVLVWVPPSFHTPVLREIKIPNTSYGEDYAIGLNISRHYRIGRIYDVIYLCRRWEDNSDASLDIVKMNGHNLYKDRIRTWELQARKNLK